MFLLICLIILSLQVMFFSTKIFKMAQMSSDGAKYATLVMGTLNVIMTLISLFLVELSGRKTLLLIGFSTMFIDTVLLTIALIFVVSFKCIQVHLYYSYYYFTDYICLGISFVYYICNGVCCRIRCWTWIDPMVFGVRTIQLVFSSISY